MSITIGSQMGPEVNEALRGLGVRPSVIDLPEASPWSMADRADVLVVRPNAAWRSTPIQPGIWPGKVRWVFSITVGMDHYPDWIYAAPAVTCGRGLAADEIADYVIAAIYRQAKDLDAVTVRSPAEWRLAASGRVIGSTIGLIGFGAIAQSVARRALALGAAVVACRHRSLPSGIDGVTLVDDPADVAARADHIVLAVPATSATRRLIDARVLARARPHAHIVNISRGSVLDQDALVAALDAGRLGFATLDVTDPEPLPEGHPLWTHPRVRLTPHISNNALAGRPRLVAKFASDLERLLAGDAPTDIVDPRLGY